MLISIYRLLYIPISVFHEEFAELLELYTVLHDSFIIAGDINIHVETQESSSLRLHEQLELFDLKQHVIGPTHIAGHTLDVVITQNCDSLIEDVVVTKYDTSHHFMINFKFKITPKEIFTKTLTCRNTKKVNTEQFRNDVSAGLASLQDNNDIKTKINCYNETMKNIVDNHAPQKRRTVKLVTRAPWFDAEYAALRKRRRKAEKKYKQTGSDEHKNVYNSLRKETTALASTKKKSYIDEKLKTNNPKELYNVVNQLLDNNEETVLPSFSSEVELANKFSEFFSNKVSKIRASITPSMNSSIQHIDLPEGIIPLSEFEPATEDEIRQIVMSFGIKCSPADPIPASLLKENCDIFIPYWLEIVNLSLEVGSMDCLKDAIIVPLIKGLNSLVDKEQFKNYRPVSNLELISKLIERVVNTRLDSHLERNQLHASNQFGYKKNHSTEYLLLKILDKLLMNCDNNMPSVILLLDLSSAFNTVDHQKLLDVLRYDIVVKGTVYKWFKSFLTNRSFKVKIGDSYSNDTPLLFGVAQGSVLGPKLFNLYSKSLYKYVESTKFSIEGFADDHQLLKHFLPSLQSYALGKGIQQCLDSILRWMNDNFLRLNDDKTKIIVIAPPSIQKEIVIRGTFVNNNCIRFADHAKNLGVILDNELSFDTHITKVVKTCFGMLRKLRSIKHLLTQDHLKSLVCSYIFSRLDYCNSQFFGLSSENISKLQHVQNCAARLILKKGNFGSLNNVFLKFHWLKIKERILYKLLLIVHKCLHQQAPDSLNRLLAYAESDRCMKLRETRVKSKFGDKAFNHIGPKLWNLLPNDIRNQHNVLVFKKMVKSLLITKGDSNSNRIFIFSRYIQSKSY